MCELREVMEQQIDDPGIWIHPLMTNDVAHAYLQDQIRTLHDVVERHLEECEHI